MFSKTWLVTAARKELKVRVKENSVAQCTHSWHLKVCCFVEEQLKDQQKNYKNKKHIETQTQVMKQSPGNPWELKARSTSIATGTKMASL